MPAAGATLVILASVPPKGTQSGAQPIVAIEVPRSLRLMGYARETNEPLDFVSMLKRSEVFSRVDLERSVREPVEDGFYFRFEITCEW
jgi:hypothetical protein